MKDEHVTVAEHFRGHFTAPTYDGSYGTEQAYDVSSSFFTLSGSRMNWSQVHGDFKNVVKRGMFEPYPHWPELYDCARRVVKGNSDLGLSFCGDLTCAKMMSEVMTLLREKHGHNVPRWWLPIMGQLRGKPTWSAK
jgi:hypothetical protein